MSLGCRRLIRQLISSLAALLLLSVTAVESAGAQTPIEPLRRPDEGRRHYEASLSLSYVPDDWSGVGVDFTGTPYAATTYSKGYTVLPSIRYGLTDHLSVNLSYYLRASDVAEKRLYSDGEKIVVTRRLEGLGELGLDYKFSPGSFHDPTLSLAVTRETAGIKVSLAQLSDPMVLSESMGVLFGRDNGSRALLLTLGSGFVANSQVDVGASLSHRVSLDLAAPSQTTFSILVTWLSDAGNNQGITLQSSFSVEERDVRAGVSIVLTQRGRV